jgi:hypothetical protein
VKAAISRVQSCARSTQSLLPGYSGKGYRHADPSLQVAPDSCKWEMDKRLATAIGSTDIANFEMSDSNGRLFKHVKGVVHVKEVVHVKGVVREFTWLSGFRNGNPPFRMHHYKMPVPNLFAFALFQMPRTAVTLRRHRSSYFSRCYD